MHTVYTYCTVEVHLILSINWKIRFTIVDLNFIYLKSVFLL